MAYALEAQTPEEIGAEVRKRSGLPDAVVSNDVYPITRNEIEAIPLEDFLATFEHVVMFPIRLTQAFLPEMKARRRGSFVFVTSARETRQEPGFAVPTTLHSIRQGACERRRAVRNSGQCHRTELSLQRNVLPKSSLH